MIWMSELLEEKQQRLDAGPMQHGHLKVFEGGKVADGYYVNPQSIWRSIRGWLVRGKARSALRKFNAGKWLTIKVRMSGRKVIEMEEGGNAL